MEIKRIDLSCDVLIVGGGIGGLTAATSLKERRPDLDILVIEKQTAGYSGKANKGGGVLQYFNDNVDPMLFLEMHTRSIGCYLGDQNLMLKYVNMNHEMMDILSGWGVNVPKRPDGKYNVMPTGNYTSMICVDLDITLQVRKRAEKLGVRFMDKTPMAELFTENGKIVGASAYSILDGTVYIISAKNVVLATGSQNYRIASMWSNGRGDGIAAAYRAGAEMRNPEFGNFAQLMKIRSHNEVVFGENFMYNGKGEFITRNFRQYRETDINSNAIREWLNQINAGNGPVYLDLGTSSDGDFMEKMWERPYGKKFRVTNDSMGAAVDGDNWEVCPLFIGEQSPIKVDNGMRTTIDNLYAVGDCCYAGSNAPGAVPAPPGRNRGSGILNAVFAGLVCAETLEKEAATEGGAICEKAVEASLDALFAPLNRTEGHTAKEVIALVQKAMGPMEQSVYMEASRMEKAEGFIAEAEELAKTLYAVDLHDLLACHEAEAMILSAKMHYAASKMRKESRGWFLREDYPEMDNENWLKWITVKNVDGEMTFATEDVPIDTYPIQPLEGGRVPVTEEEKQSPLYEKYFLRDMVAPDQSRYDEVEFPVDPDTALIAEDMNKLFDEGYLPMEKGFCRMNNGALTLANLTYMPGVTPEMFDWWFAWHGIQPMRYKIWNPEQHFYCQTRNMDQALDPNLSLREKLWNTTHDIYEDCSLGKENVIITFRNPVDIGFDPEKYANFDGTIICSGGPDAAMIMCHFLRPVEGGCELRTRFWLGYAVINGKPVKVFPDDAQIPTDMMKGLLMHNIKEFTHLAAILPEVYAEYKDKWQF